jgi:hypothetical protein
MNRMNLSHSWEERMMYLASMHFGFPFTNFAFTSTCVKLFITRKSELNRVCLLEKSGGSERETERETKMETSRTRWWFWVKRGSDDVWRFYDTKHIARCDDTKDSKNSPWSSRLPRRTSTSPWCPLSRFRTRPGFRTWKTPSRTFRLSTLWVSRPGRMFPRSLGRRKSSRRSRRVKTFFCC